jgi:hypothetical protein
MIDLLLTAHLTFNSHIKDYETSKCVHLGDFKPSRNSRQASVNLRKIKDFIWSNWERKNTTCIKSIFYGREGRPVYNIFYIEKDRNNLFYIRRITSGHEVYTYRLERIEFNNPYSSGNILVFKDKKGKEETRF